MRQFNITVNGVQYSVAVEEVGAASAPVAAPVAAAPVTAPVAPVAAPADAPAPAAAPAPVAGGEKINAPMPGNINDVRVSAGQQVKKGDILVILEAMKMENEIMAPHDATVAAVHVNKGDSVESGTALVSLQ